MSRLLIMEGATGKSQVNTKRTRREHEANTKRIRREHERNTRASSEHRARVPHISGLRVASLGSLEAGWIAPRHQRVPGSLPPHARTAVEGRAQKDLPTQGCVKLTGPRAVPARSGPHCSRTFRFSKPPGVVLRAASRDGSRSCCWRIPAKIRLPNLRRREHTAGIRWNRTRDWEGPFHVERAWRGSE